jgi:hypothetical protein
LNNVFEFPGDDAVDVDHPLADLLVEGNQILSARDDGIEIRSPTTSPSIRWTS